MNSKDAVERQYIGMLDCRDSRLTESLVDDESYLAGYNAELKKMKELAEDESKQQWTERSFRLPDDRGIIKFSAAVLTHMYSYAQNNFRKTEAGGQLFSKTPESEMVLIDLATGPYPSDRRSRCSFHPDLNVANRDREENFKLDYHAVGLWHTHPEGIPSPSATDRTTACEYLRAFDGEMDGFLLVILGNRGNPLNICVWLASTDPDNPWLKLDEA